MTQDDRGFPLSEYRSWQRPAYKDLKALGGDHSQIPSTTVGDGYSRTVDITALNMILLIETSR